VLCERSVLGEFDKPYRERSAAARDQRTLSVVNHCRRQQSQARVAVFLVVPTKEPLREGATVLRQPKRSGNSADTSGCGTDFRVRIVIRDMRPTMGFVTPKSASKKATGLELIEVSAVCAPHGVPTTQGAHDKVRHLSWYL